MLASTAIKSLFSWRTVDEAAVGGFRKMCHQLVVWLGDGVAGSEDWVGGPGDGPVMVLVSMWMMPHRMSMCRVKRAVMPRLRRDSRAVANADAVMDVSGKETSSSLRLPCRGLIAVINVHRRDCLVPSDSD